jgi:hypothetical protein
VLLENSELLIKDYISYLTQTTLFPNYTNHVVLMSSLSNLNQYQHSIGRVFSVLTYWTRTHGVTGSNRGDVEISFLSFSRHVVILHYRKNYYTKVSYFKKSISMHHRMALLQVALMSIAPHKFVPQPCWYCRL